VYLVEPFTLGSEMTDVQRLACLGLLRCFTAMLNAIPEHVRSNISVQVCYK
jgi:mediator of RNA polymerase II transcription subunit 13